MLYTAQSMIDSMMHAYFDASEAADRQRLFAGLNSGTPALRPARRFRPRFMPGLRGFGPGGAFAGVQDARVERAR
jgi:hypothetical protein